MCNIETYKESCCGCGACKNICPKGAITMKTNDEGFLYPFIDMDKCVNCGLCKQSCPLSQTSFKYDSAMPKCYAVKTTSEIMSHSSSGGIFTVLANYVFEKGGYVCGAVFDNEWMVEHKVISDKSGLYELQTSKYVQSDTKSVYSEIKNFLCSDKYVLFSGTPCQVAGLYSFLGKSYENLLTVDVFCHGVPSPEVWKRYLKELTDENITDINFRDKLSSGCEWNKFALTIKSKDKEIISEYASKNTYMLGFLRNLYLRKSCYHCNFAKMPRHADFSLGDFWEYSSVDNHTDTKLGISAVLLNTEKAENIFSDVKSQFEFIREVKISDIYHGNPVLYKSVSEHPNRDKFFENFQKENKIIPTIKKHLAKRDVAILNFSSFSKPNFGAGLVGYAMEKAVEKSGYIPHTINFISEDSLYSYTEQDSFSRFQNKFLHLTGICKNKFDLQNYINSEFDKFIIGSDQVLRHPWHYNFIYYLDWVFGKKNLISYAASFGISELTMNPNELEYAKRCVDRFDSFSVREHSGADIMKKYFAKDDIPVVCDPTMLLDAEDYQEIIDSENLTVPEGEYVVYYFLDEEPGILLNFQKKYPVINAHKDEQGNYRTFGEWLNLIKNAKYVITDSFHGSVFSIIYKKQFIALTTKTRGNERLDSLMKIINNNRLIYDRNNLTEENLFRDYIDYSEVETRIHNVQHQGYEFLKNALNNDGNIKENLLQKNLDIIKDNEIPYGDLIKEKGIPFFFKVYTYKKLNIKARVVKIFGIPVIKYRKIINC